jgi:hypothetical protein
MVYPVEGELAKGLENLRQYDEFGAFSVNETACNPTNMHLLVIGASVGGK